MIDWRDYRRSWGDLASLETLALYDNDLTGEIPSSLGNLVNLNLMYIEGNEISGCIPAGLEYKVSDVFLPNC